MVLLSTSMGDIKIELYENEAPETVKNFLTYVNDKFYDGTIFHRVIPGFMIQGGGFTETMQQKPTRPPIKNEAGNGLKNDTGTIAMARTAIPDSATSQFFINVKNNDFLNRDKAQDGVGYAVFGKVIEGMDVVRKIEQVPTGRKGMHSDVPLEPVVIQSVRVIAPSPAKQSSSRRPLERNELRFPENSNHQEDNRYAATVVAKGVSRNYILYLVLRRAGAECLPLPRPAEGAGHESVRLHSERAQGRFFRESGRDLVYAVSRRSVGGVTRYDAPRQTHPSRANKGQDRGWQT